MYFFPKTKIRKGDVGNVVVVDVVVGAFLAGELLFLAGNCWLVVTTISLVQQLDNLGQRVSQLFKPK